MFGKPRHVEAVKTYAWQDSDDMVKAELPESQYPSSKWPWLDMTDEIQRPLNGSCSLSEPTVGGRVTLPPTAPQRDQAASSGHKGMNGTPKSS
jgi:hypothetical protein